MNYPHLDIWLTSTGRQCAVECAQKIVRQCTYPDWRFLIFESQPENDHDTVEVFKSLDCDKKVWVGDYPPLGWVYNLFMHETERFFLRVDDDCWFVCNPTEMILDAMKVLDVQPLHPRFISNVPLECNPRLAYDPTTQKSPEGANAIPRFMGYATNTGFGPLGLVGHPGSLPIVDKRYILPWNETCHWRQVELYHILDGERRGMLSAYMLWWWGVMGHFSPAGIDGVDRSKNLNLYETYRDRGYFGRRPEDTWGTCCLGTDIPNRLTEEEPCEHSSLASTDKTAVT